MASDDRGTGNRPDWQGRDPMQSTGSNASVGSLWRFLPWLLLALLAAIPVLGPVLLVVVLLAGLGALNLRLHRAYTAG